MCIRDSQAEVRSVHDGDVGRIGRIFAAVADKEQLAGFVISHIVGIVGELDLPGKSERRALVDPQFAEGAVGDVKAAGSRIPREAMRLDKASDALPHLVRLQVDHFN